jgi:N-acetylmuramoyl-L-alanine amidase
MRRRSWALGLASGLLVMPMSAAARPAGTVVVDAGHGGGQTGTRTAGGVLEKDIVLAVALEVERLLSAAGVKVSMTRKGDVELGLPARAELAAREGASVYLSIHANWAAVPERRGVETYILSAEVSDADAAEALHLEEGATAAPTERASGGELDSILFDLEKSAAHQESARLAKLLQDALGGVKGLGPSRGLRQAPFRVLKDARAAAVLVELGYLSNPAQGAYLATAAGQKAAAEALARGVLRFLGKR